MTRRRVCGLILTLWFLIVICFSGCAVADLTDSFSEENNSDTSLQEYNGRMCVDGCLLIKFDSSAEGIAVAGTVTILDDFESFVPGLYLIKTPEEMTVADAVTYYEQMPGVVYAEPNYITVIPDNQDTEENVILQAPLTTSFMDSDLASSVTNDPYFSEQWGLMQMHVPEAWSITRGSQNVIVAVVDSGIMYTHEDLEANMWHDGNGNCGYDFGDDDADPMDTLGHGTHVAGIIGAVGNNGIGVSGVAQKVSLMAVKVSNRYGMLYNTSIANGIRYAVENGADIINLSFQSRSYDRSIEDVLKKADNLGVLVVCAAGNGDYRSGFRGWDIDVTPCYPASFNLENILTVANLRQEQDAAVLASDSNYGILSVDTGAPGTNIYSTNNRLDNLYIQKSGTSMSAPMVAGVAALILSKNPTLSVDSVKTIIMESTVYNSSLSGKTVTGGLVDAYQALLQTPDPQKKTRTTVTAFRGEKTGTGFTFSRAVVVTGATLPGASGVTITNTSGNGWYSFNLETDGFSGDGTLYFQVPLDVIELKGYTVNDVSFIGSRTTYLKTEGRYAKYSAVITRDGFYTIDFKPDAAKPDLVTVEPELQIEEPESPEELEYPITTDENMATATFSTTSPLAIFGIMAGLAVAGVLVRKKSS